MVGCEMFDVRGKFSREQAAKCRGGQSFALISRDSARELSKHEALLHQSVA